MEHVRGKVVHAGRVLHEDLDIALTLIEPSTGSKHYRGCFQIQHAPTDLKAKGPFELHFDDGRIGTFKAPRLHKRPAGIKVSFTLDGAPRKPTNRS